jgi:hypothetical protein
MSKVVLARKPTFDLPVVAQLLGGGKLEFTVTYKAMRLSEFKAFIERVQAQHYKGKPDSDVVMEIAEGWDLDQPFTAEGIEGAIEDAPGLGGSISRRFVEEYERVRWGN